MPKYILIYKNNEAEDWSAQPEPEVKRVMEAWGQWVGSMAKRDAGEAFKFSGKSVSKDGTKDADNLLTGFSVIEAKDFDEALAVAQKAPAVLWGTGSIEVYEAFGF
ncbi:MAG TPA: YciI family protein [Candidatus Saccharimonadales bacterium]